MDYCNTTTDLSRAFAKIEDPSYRGLKEARGYVNHSGNVFKLTGSGFVEAVYEGGVKMSLAANLGAVDAAREFFYDTTNDVLYFYPTGGIPDNFTILYGEDWANVKAACVDIASRDAESILDKKYTIPLPKSPQGSASQPYDRDFTHAVALRACGHILSRVEVPQFDSLGAPQNMSARLLSEGEKIFRQYNAGERAFSWEITPDEIGGHNLFPQSGNTSTGIIQLRGKYDVGGMDDPFWKLKITTGGAVGAAEYAMSFDNGDTYQDPEETSSTWELIAGNIYIRFLEIGGVGDFVQNDVWQIEINSPSREETNTAIRSVPINVL
jgi:hypothetical protein